MPSTQQEKAAVGVASGDISLSRSHHSVGSETGRSSEVDENAPEVLVRKDDKTVQIIRAFVIVLLVAASLLFSLFVYYFSRNLQQSSYNYAFASVTSKLAATFLSEISLKFWMAKTISDSTALLLRVTNSTSTNLIMPQDNWQSITREARVHANANLVSWNPLLKSDEERRAFEQFAQTQTMTIGSQDPCFMCGDAGRGYTNPEKIFFSAGWGYYQCSLLEASGRLGLIPNDNCELAALVGSSECICGDLPPGTEVLDNIVDIPETLFQFDKVTGEKVADPYLNPPYLPTWTSSALELTSLPVLYNQMSDPLWKTAIDIMVEYGIPVLSETTIRTGAYYEAYPSSYLHDTSAQLYYPVTLGNEVVGSVSFDMPWKKLISSAFPPQSQFVDIVVESSCGQNFTYTVDVDIDALVLKGEGDLHDAIFSSRVHSTSFEDYRAMIQELAGSEKLENVQLNYCQYRFHVFSSQAFRDQYLNSRPIIFALVTASIVIFTSIVFCYYDSAIAHRQRILMVSAMRTNAVVSSLFPKSVRDRLLQQATEQKGIDNSAFRESKLRMNAFVTGQTQDPPISSAPIADLFASATVMVLDIAGFTAWSSEREPSKVFQLLENVYGAFDEVARQLSVFKVETIGDSYVAVCGVPTKRELHAPVMVKFAERCLRVMTKVTRRLEVHLGPSTADLKARVGLHSGPVTAGVLRGERARFQLFGDTVDMAIKMESSGTPGYIHASKATADLLIQAGKLGWLQKREEPVAIKGKGEVTSFWVSMGTESDIQSSDSEDRSLPESEGCHDRDQIRRLVRWNVEVIYSHLERVTATHYQSHDDSTLLADRMEVYKAEEEILEGRSSETGVIDEMSEILPLQEVNVESLIDLDKTKVVVHHRVREQLTDFVFRIADLYRNVPFHNFEHVSHVVMSASKLMNRIINPDGINYNQDPAKVARDIHELTLGVSSDPILQFAVVFSALIHDVDHTGLTNAELNAMNTPESVRYRHQSVAEQNSVDIAWAILMESKYRELRACIYSNKEELYHFRQSVVNAVIATDIADKRLKESRESRWDVAFPSNSEVSRVFKKKPRSEAEMESNRKATVVFEYIIQAADVAHTMQHWHTYQKFNRRLFEERYVAWLNGHAPKEPSLGWYGGELWFFDNYVIPLVEKLDKCGVFGVSYDEYVTYAKENRREWQLKGENLVAVMKRECDEKYADEASSNAK